jgi:cystathionine gamma-synthase
MSGRLMAPTGRTASTPGPTWGLDVEFTDTSDLAAVAAAIRPGRTRLIWAETPANPMWEITDLAAVCELAHSAGVRVAVDNTVATPVLTRPLELGADLVVHSATKYLNGHSDVLAGAVLTARRDPFWERIRFAGNGPARRSWRCWR